jgi:hypothetical protein
LEFFANDVCNPSGYGEGQYWLGDATVVTDAGGLASFTATVGAANSGQFIAATATDPMNDTSAFSACLVVTAPATTVEGPISGRVAEARPADTTPISASAGKTVDSAASSSADVPRHSTVTGAAAPVHAGAVLAPRPADTDWFWQEFGHDPLTAI